MTIVFTDNFAGTDGTKLQDRSGWSISASITTVPALQINASNQLKAAATTGSIFYYHDAASADHAVQCVWRQNSSHLIALACRGVDRLNYFSVRVSGGKLAFYKMVANVETLIKYFNGSSGNPNISVAVGDVLRLEAVGSSIRIFHNGTEYYTHTSAELLTATKVGFALLGSLTLDPVADDFQVETLGGGSGGNAIAITHPLVNAVVAGFGPVGARVARVPVKGTYGGAPTAIEARVVLASTGAVVAGFDWATLVATPAGNAYAAAIVGVPEAARVAYKVQVRFANDTAAAAESNPFYIGEVWWAHGQSNMDRWEVEQAGRPATVEAACFLYRSSDAGGVAASWFAPTGNGTRTFFNARSLATGRTIGMVMVSTGGSSAGQLTPPVPPATDTTHTTQWTRVLAGFADCGYDYHGLLWNQGYGDAVDAPDADYKNCLTRMYDYVLTRSVRTEAQMPYLVIRSGRSAEIEFGIGASTANSGWNRVRRAQTDWTLERAGGMLSHDVIDLPHLDAAHRSGPGYAISALRASQSMTYLESGVGALAVGPRALSAIRVDDATLEVVFDAPVTGLTGTTGLTGWKVSNNDFVSDLTVVSAQIVGGRVRLGVSGGTVAVGVTRVWYLWGQEPVLTNRVVATGGALVLPGQPSIRALSVDLGIAPGSGRCGQEAEAVTLAFVAPPLSGADAGHGLSSEAVVLTALGPNGGLFPADAGMGHSGELVVLVPEGGGSETPSGRVTAVAAERRVSKVRLS